MDFSLTDEQKLLQETVRGFVAKECPPQTVRAIFDGERQAVPALWKGLAEIGIAGLVVPEAHGGAGLELLELALVAEELGRGAVPVPFLLENNVSYFRMPDEDYDEAEFLRELHRESGCGLLLDLHNLYVNERNLGIDSVAFLDRLPLEAVVEVHVAGGMEMDGFYLDAHSGPVLEPVWRMLERVLPRCPNLGGVVFELFGSWYQPMGEDGLRRQLDRMRLLWSRHQPSPERWLR